MVDAVVSGTVLVAIAREAIGEQLGEGQCGPRDDPWLQERGATFVTLRKSGELRGCIGSVDARRTLGEDVAHNARAAAFSDPRFPPLARHELEGLEVEVSVLSPRSPVPAATESEALEKLRPGVDGVYLEYGEARATFLPQVWENIPDPLAFLSELRLKAELPARFWHADIKLSRYTVEKYDDERSRP